ncbi:MAG: CapA family protein [Prevotellaceae bacterium]|jgi:poly-gamma-glutamate capsule biosynthesis protein CapA/YwtB (metallophosphatase superfamily)|nr:CapA family protein [Prevotellaceae bacterium]
MKFFFFLLLFPVCMAAQEVTIVATGDIMLGTIFPSRDYLPAGEDCSGILKPLHNALSGGDIVFGNLEGVLTDHASTPKRCNDPSVCYTFGMPTHFVNCLVDAGFNLLSVANNHVGDFGEQGRRSTVETLKKAGIHFAGLAGYCATDTFTLNGVKYGFAAFAPNSGTVNLNDIPAAEKIVRELAAACRIVIVSFHGGAEGSGRQHVTRETEYFIGENRGNVYEFAHRMIDAGADVLLGHGPHVTRAVEVYRNRFIAYSMGNFCTFDRINVSGVSGIAPVFKIHTDENGAFLNAEIISTFQEKRRPPQPDKQQRALKVIQQLTQQDFPEMATVITVSDDGAISRIRN